MIWATLAFVALLMGDRSDNEPGRIVFYVLGMLLFTGGLIAAPWGELA